MSEREAWEKELEALGRDSAAENAELVENAAPSVETLILVLLAATGAAVFRIYPKQRRRTIWAKF